MKKSRQPNPFIDPKDPKGNIAKFGKAEGRKDAKKAAIAKMMRKKGEMK